MSELDKSDSYYRKLCLKQLEVLPTQSEIKSRLGDQLTEVFFESCLPVLKPYLGLSPVLEGPGEDLWVSPSDLLIGKVRLKPPLTSKHVKALTHQGILEIGKIVENKVNKEYENEKAKSLAENELMLKYLAEKEKQEAVSKVREEERLKQENMANKLKSDFQNTLMLEMAKLEEKLQIEKDEAVEDGKREVEELMQAKLEVAVLETVKRLTEQFAVELVKQSQCLHKHFWHHIKEEKEKLKKAVEDERTECTANLKRLRAEMYCENIANVMYVLAKERRRCDCEKQAVERNFLARLEELNLELEERGEKLQKTISELEAAGLKVQAREEALFEIIKQFQKFIYFVLRAVPTQAEYLLNVEKLMIFELTKTVMDTKPEYFTPTTQSVDESSHKSSTSEEITNLVANDFHNCDNQVRYMPSTHTLASDQELPLFSFAQNLYVREDFRNMISQGLKISPNNELWNFELEDVTEYIGPENSSHSRTLVEPLPHRRQSGAEKKSVVSVRFSRVLDRIPPFEEEKFLQSHSFDNNEPKQHSQNLVNLPVSDEKNSPNQSQASLNVETKRQVSKLSIARDSLIVIATKVRRSTATFKDIVENLAETDECPIDDNQSEVNVKRSVKKVDSLIKTGRRSVNLNLSNKELLIDQTSRLSTHRNSLELLRTNSLKSFSSNASNVRRSEGQKYPKQRSIVNVGAQIESADRGPQISHVEVIPEENRPRVSVMFHTQPSIIETLSNMLLTKETDEVEQKPEEKMTIEEKYPSTSEVAVVGDRESTVHLESQDEFTAKRVNSFVRIFRENPSLCQLFTPGCNY